MPQWLMDWNLWYLGLWSSPWLFYGWLAVVGAMLIGLAAAKRYL